VITLILTLFYAFCNTCHNRGVKLTYETAVATVIQFIVLGLLNIANGLNSIVTTCHRTGTDCVSNLLVSIIFFILATAWFALVCFLGYMAQERRSKRFAQALIIAEVMIAMVAYFNARHHTDILGLATSVIDLALAGWIIVLAFRVMRANGKRITASGRRRRRLKNHAA